MKVLYKKKLKRGLMKKIILFFLLNCIFSANISEDVAINIAENFYYSKNDSRDNIFMIESVQTQSINEESVFYVIDLAEKGFILISYDNLVRPILGYSFEEDYKYDNLPTNLYYMFSLYKNQINEQREERSTAEQYITDEWNKYSRAVDYEGQTRIVAPLITARFDQGTAWNDMCPEDGDGPGGNVLVGCVAVSMAQIMHYWSYPEIGYGSHGYNHQQYGYQSADFGNSNYDYSQMPNNIASTESQELLYHCGVAVNMGYGTDGSGAQVFGSNPSSYYAMRNYFLFKNSMDQVEPWQYGTDAYRELLQEELDNNRPIIYVGYSNDGGHAWNIDGYDGDYFHNNWGWGGSQNGYFLLSSLNSFDSGQGALINIEPQSLNNPNVILQNFEYEEFIGDGDNIVNPGETINLYTSVENLIPWVNATDIDMVLSTDDDDLVINDDYVSFNNLSPGNSFTNTNQPFTITFSPEASFSNHQLKLTILSFGNNGEFNENEYYINIEVSLDQTGFPYQISLLDDNNQEYNAVTTVQSPPLLYDITNDGLPEIFFGDGNGYFHGVDNSGNALNGFPIELEGNNAEIWGSAVADDIDNDGEIEFIITSKNKHCYIIDQYGNIELDYETDQYLMSTPSLANLDNDNDLEIVFYGYVSSGDVFAINHDGTSVNNFPVQLNEKVLKGGAIYDLDNNGKDDIVVATENDKLIAIIYDNGSIVNLFESTDKFKSAPSIIDYNGNVIITAGDEGGNFYGINLDGSLAFNVITGNNIRSSAGFIELDNQLGIFFGSEDGNLYGIDINGNALSGWPQNISGDNNESKLNSNPIFADINNDNIPEVIITSENGQLIIYSINGVPYENYPLNYNYGFIGSPSIIDIDNDGDLEIIIGTSQNLSVIDIKENSNASQNYWNTYQGDSHRSGVYIYNSSNLLIGDLNTDGLIDVLDLVMIINIIIGNHIATTEQLITGDLNNDGTIDVLDVVQLVNTILD